MVQENKQWNILLICSYFPPDTSIAAVRPFMFAKYLLKKGYRVTVLRSGKFSQAPDRSFEGYPDRLKIINALGDNCPVMQYESDQDSYTVKKKLEWMSGEKRETLRRIYHRLLNPVLRLKQLKDSKNIFLKQKQMLNRIAGKYDIVISTFGDIENVYAGFYASKYLGCKWILDIRDPITSLDKGIVWNFFTKKIEKEAVRISDACIAVSNGLSEEIYCKTGVKPYTIYNGYDGEKLRKEDDETNSRIENKEAVLKFCYTGAICDERVNSLEIFCKEINFLIRKNSIKMSQIRLSYAGANSGIAAKILKNNRLENILDDRGYLSREETYALQDESDIFLLFSRNTKTSKGVVTGKFFEGIRARKPVLAIITGDEPDSELYLINQKYHYGFCYEKAKAQTEEGLVRFIEKAAAEKELTGSVSFHPKSELFDKFRYASLTNELEIIIKDILQ